MPGPLLLPCTPNPGPYCEGWVCAHKYGHSNLQAQVPSQQDSLLDWSIVRLLWSSFDPSLLSPALAKNLHLWYLIKVLITYTAHLSPCLPLAIFHTLAPLTLLLVHKFPTDTVVFRVVFSFILKSLSHTTAAQIKILAVFNKYLVQNFSLIVHTFAVTLGQPSGPGLCTSSPVVSWEHKPGKFWK